MISLKVEGYIFRGRFSEVAPINVQQDPQLKETSVGS